MITSEKHNKERDNIRKVMTECVNQTNGKTTQEAAILSLLVLSVLHLAEILEEKE